MLAAIFKNLSQTRSKEDKTSPFNFVSLPGCTWDPGLRNKMRGLENFEEADLFLIPENANKGVKSGAMGERYVCFCKWYKKILISIRTTSRVLECHKLNLMLSK